MDAGRSANGAPRDLAEEVACAWELHAGGRSYRYIAEALGCSVSTAHERVKLAAAAAEYAGDDDRAAARRRDLTTTDAWLARLEDAHKYGRADPVALVGAVVRLLDRRAKLLGLDAATRFVVADERKAPTLDPEIVAAVRQARERADRERAALESGEPHDGQHDAA